MREIIEKQIQESFQIICVAEEAYLNELVAYRLHFEGYKYDWLIDKLAKVPVLGTLANLNNYCGYKFSKETYCYHY